RQSIHISYSMQSLKKIGFSHEKGLIETAPLNLNNIDVFRVQKRLSKEYGIDKHLSLSILFHFHCPIE
ncbi:MAG: hypothetical protein N0E48_15580, partial [Candidatus Thiodiazotropha endolucinida]|nr:hypothetical protein [Candidatus Thiodiazotropha taylori]MCW4344756.1 hypothetical protein [Candidatus Thiodiazotropha endolucinida]